RRAALVGADQVAGRPDRQEGLEGADPGHARPHRHGQVPLRRDGLPVHLAGDQRQRQAEDHPVPAREDEQDPEVPVIRALAAAVRAAWVRAAPARAAPPTVLDFEGRPDNADAVDLYPNSGAHLVTDRCLTGGPRLRAAAPDYFDCGVVPDGHNSAKALSV